jgi:hypothetical protein
VGTLVGTVAAIPTTGIGALVGSGVGAAHGPWIKLPGIGGGKKEGKDDKQKGDAKEEGESKGDGEMKDNVEDDDDVIPDPEALRKAADEVAKRQSQQKDTDKTGQQGERKKPRKLEVRSQKSVGTSA